MSAVLANLPSKAAGLENITLLTVSTDGSDYQMLRQIFHHQDWQIARARTCQEAGRLMAEREPAVVICDMNLGDGCWRQLLEQAQSLEHPPMIVVVAPSADNNLWSEVLNLGGYDVLLRPFEKTEVIRVISMAWRHWRETVLHGVHTSYAVSGCR